MTTTHQRLAKRRTAERLTTEEFRRLRVCLDEQRRFRIEQIFDLTDPRRAEREAVITEIDAQLLAGARFALAQIEAALARMRHGRYGICAECTQPIAPERLEILPMISLCIRCQGATQPREAPRVVRLPGR